MKSLSTQTKNKGNLKCFHELKKKDQTILKNELFSPRS